MTSFVFLLLEKTLMEVFTFSGQRNLSKNNFLLWLLMLMNNRLLVVFGLNKSIERKKKHSTFMRHCVL